jgi:threonine/homoserine/homoserine lactone efflux protein
VLGLSAILASSQIAFTFLKYVGAAYLAYVAVSLIRSAPPGAEEIGQESRASGERLFRTAALVNVLNPKVALFFLAFLPQFVDPQAAVPAVQILCLGLWFNFAGTIVNLVIAAVTAQTAALVAKVQWIRIAARWLAATVMGGLAVQLAFSDRR